MHRYACWVLWFIPVFIGILAAKQYLDARGSSSVIREPLEVAEPEQDLGVQLMGGPANVTFKVRNRSNTPIRIVGIPPGCSENACYTPKEMGPLTIGPSEELELQWSIDPIDPGPFECILQVAYHHDTIDAVRLSVKGHWRK